MYTNRTLANKKVRITIIMIVVCIVLSSLIINYSIKELDYTLNYDILFKPQNAHFLFYNTSGFIRKIECHNVNDCVNKLYAERMSIRNVVSFNALYNFTRYPMDSEKRYTSSDVYLLIVISSLAIFINLVMCFFLFRISEENNDSLR